MRSPRILHPAGMAEDLGRADDVVVVLERLALALEDDAGDRPLRDSRRTVRTCSTISQALEVAREAEAARLAEHAAEGAARPATRRTRSSAAARAGCAPSRSVGRRRSGTGT